jgi:acylglycerol lipase
MNRFEFSWRTPDGLRLFAQGWEPEGPSRAAVCLVHGGGEHSGRYAHVAAALTDASFALLTFDLRGHGRSEGPRGHAPSFDVLLDDIGHLLAEAEERFPGQPRFLYGHSLGGSLVLNYVLRRRPALAGVVATSPFLRPAFTPPAWKVALGRVMRRLWPTLSMYNEVDARAISRDPEVVRRAIADPLNHSRISARAGIDILEAGEWAIAHAAGFPLPLLIMHGSADALASVEASRQFAARVPGDCTFKLWEGLYHETHNEPEKQDVLAFVVDWLRAHTS